MEEKKASYRIPLGVRLKNFLSPTNILIILIFIFLILVEQGISTQPYEVKVLFVISFFVLPIIPLLLPWFDNYSDTAMRTWVVENVPCPACGGRISKCRLYLSGYNYTKSCTVQCGECNKRFLFDCPPGFLFDGSFVLIGEIEEEIPRTYIKFLLVILLIFVAVLVLFALVLIKSL